MKTFMFTRRLVIATVVIAALCLASYPGKVADAEDAYTNFTGKIMKVEGTAQIRKAGETGWVAAKHGMKLAVDDQIITGIDSRVEVLFVRNGKRSKVIILDEADMSLMTLNLDKVTGDSEILLDLAIGHIIIKTDPLKGKSRFEVLTPTSMTAVRGTGFEVWVYNPEGPERNESIIQ